MEREEEGDSQPIINDWRWAWMGPSQVKMVLVRKMIFSIKVFVTLLDYLKIPQVTVLGDLRV
jgi:hypothetical protein